MFRKTHPISIAIFLVLALLAFASVMNIQDSYEFYVDSKERYRKASVDKQYTKEQLESRKRGQHAKVSVLGSSVGSGVDTVHRIDLRGELPVPEEDRVFRPGEIIFEILEQKN